jgi:hypothetical protein
MHAWKACSTRRLCIRNETAIVSIRNFGSSSQRPHTLSRKISTGLLLAAPLLAVIFAYRPHARNQTTVHVPRRRHPGQVISSGWLISLGTPTGHIPPQDEAL